MSQGKTTAAKKKANTGASSSEGRQTVAGLSKKLDAMEARMTVLEEYSAQLEEQLSQSKGERRNEQLLYTTMMFSMMGELFTGQANYLKQHQGNQGYLTLERAGENINDDTLLAVRFDTGWRLITKKDGGAFNEDVSNSVLPAFLETLTEEEQQLSQIAVNLIHNRVEESQGE